MEDEVARAGPHGVEFERLDVPVVGRVGEDVTHDFDQLVPGDVGQSDRWWRTRPLDQLLPVGRPAVVDGLVSVDDAFEYVRRRMARQSRVQSPRKWEFDVQGRIVIARSQSAEAAARTTAGPASSLPPPAAIQVPDPVGSSTIPVLRQPRWWAGTALFFATATLLTWLAAAVLADWLYGSAPDEYLPSERSYFVAALLGAWAWVLAYAATDAYRHFADPNPIRPHWYDLTLGWLRHLVAVGQPSGWRAFLRGALAAVPVNIVAALTLSIATTAAAYTYLGSSARDRTFPPLFAILTALMLTAFVRLTRRQT